MTLVPRRFPPPVGPVALSLPASLDLAVVLLVSMLGALPAAAAPTCPSATNEGEQFLFTFPDAEIDTGIGGATLAIMIGDDATPYETYEVEVTIPQCNSGNPYTLSVTPETAATLDVCDAARFTGTGPASRRWITVERVDEEAPYIAVVLKNQVDAGFSEDAFLVLPTSRLGNSYWALGYRGISSASPGRRAYVATDDLTLTYRLCDGTTDTESLAANDVFQDKCDPGTSLQDGTGFQVSSDGPAFAFITGSRCSFVPPNAGACDVLNEMMPPSDWAGTEYFVTEFPKRYGTSPPGDLFRILATEANTEVTIAAVGSWANDNSSGSGCGTSSPFTLTNAGDWCDVSISPGAYITSDEPIFIGQFMKANQLTDTGDPSFLLVTPVDHFRCGHRFFSFEGFPYDSTTKDGSYVNIVATTDDLPDVKLDGVRIGSGTTCLDYGKVDYGSTGWSWTRCRLADPPTGGEQHVLDTSNVDYPIAAYAYGMRDRGAYSYPTGIGF